jgi:hypothetical protein
MPARPFHNGEKMTIARRNPAGNFDGEPGRPTILFLLGNPDTNLEKPEAVTAAIGIFLREGSQR